ncbi:MAG: acyl-CoA dehydrogenase family protein, partial [Spongiibacteraceae bacterium]
MDFNLSEEQEMLRAGADRFVRSHYTLEQRRQQIASGVPCKREHWAQFAELGWLMLNVPASAGGLGASLIETSVLMQSFGRGPVLEPYINTAVLAARVLERATENQIARQLLTDIANGERRFALAHGEPNGADNPRAVKTAASPHRDKYRLSGRKFMALDAPSADTLIVSGTVEGESAYALFLVEHAAAGV